MTIALRPFCADDRDRLQALGDDPAIARMLLSIHLPWTSDLVAAWMVQFDDSGVPYRRAVITADGELVGAAGLFRRAHSGGLAYWIGRPYWRRGYAKRAAQLLVAAAFAPDSAVQVLNCGVFQDNPASIRVLEGLGFERIGEDRAKSPARLEEAPEYLYRLSRTNYES